MSDIALFTIGTLVFFLGATGLVLFGLDTFRTWSEASTETDDGAVEPDGTTREGLTSPR
jgi:hypothetical protein